MFGPYLKFRGTGVTKMSANHSGDICTTRETIENQFVWAKMYIFCYFRGPGGTLPILLSSYPVSPISMYM